jgi:hypothetical protein
MNDEERNQKMKLSRSAAEYVAGKVTEGKTDGDKGYPLNRGDIIILVMLIDRELPVASSDFRDPFNGKRLAAIREKLGSFAIDASQMSREEAQQFRE